MLLLCLDQVPFKSPEVPLAQRAPLNFTGVEKALMNDLLRLYVKMHCNFQPKESRIDLLVSRNYHPHQKNYRTEKMFSRSIYNHVMRYMTGQIILRLFFCNSILTIMSPVKENYMT